MTTTTDLNAMIRDAMDSGIVHGLVPRETADLMRARLDELTSGHQPDGCLMCAVRALTEGEPKLWWPNEPASVKGVVLVQGRVRDRFSLDEDGKVPFVDLWLGGHERVRIRGYGFTLAGAMAQAAPQVGDTLTVAYTGQGTIERGKHAGKPYRMHTVEITRGHH